MRFTKSEQADLVWSERRVYVPCTSEKPGRIGPNSPPFSKNHYLRARNPFQVQSSRHRQGRFLLDIKGERQESRFEIRDSRFEIRDSRFEIRDSRFEIRESRFESRDSRVEIRDQATSLGTDIPFFASRISNLVSQIPPLVRALEKETALGVGTSVSIYGRNLVILRGSLGT